MGSGSMGAKGDREGGRLSSVTVGPPSWVGSSAKHWGREPRRGEEQVSGKVTCLIRTEAQQCSPFIKRQFPPRLVVRAPEPDAWDHQLDDLGQVTHL